MAGLTREIGRAVKSDGEDAPPSPRVKAAVYEPVVAVNKIHPSLTAPAMRVTHGPSDVLVFPLSRLDIGEVWADAFDMAP